MDTSILHNKILVGVSASTIFLLLVGFGVFFTERIVVDNINSRSHLNINYPHLGATAVGPVSDEASTSSAFLIPETDEGESVYAKVVNSCNYEYAGGCVHVRSGPGTEYEIVNRLRNDIVLKVEEAVSTDEYVWYKIIFDETLRYPERLEGEWYIAAPYLEILVAREPVNSWEDEEEVATTTKRIVVNRSEQVLYAYDGEQLFMQVQISTGNELTPTPSGTFNVFKKTPSRYMQGPIPGLAVQDEYDLPGVPWNLYFTSGGAVIHGAYWHNNFGNRHSHGCVNLRYEDAKKLYDWTPLGTTVEVIG